MANSQSKSGGQRGSPPRGRGPDADRFAVIHANLCLFEAADEAQLDAVLERADVRNRAVQRVGPATLVLPRGALPALRKRLAELGAPFRHGALDPEDGR